MPLWVSSLLRRASITATAKDFVASVIGQIAPHDSVARFEGLGVDVIEAFGRFISPTEVQAGDRVVTARRIVIATGSSPFVPPIPGLSDLPSLYKRNSIRVARAT